MVGARGFEPPTSATPLQRATRLRHAPTEEAEILGPWGEAVKQQEPLEGPCGPLGAKFGREVPSRARAYEDELMVRPMRRQWRSRTTVRRRHRTWVASMVLATAGWGVWWLTIVLSRWAPESAPSPLTAAWVGFAFAAVGIFLAIFTLRARPVWVLLAAVPMFANGSLMFLPWVADDLSLVLQSGQDGQEHPAGPGEPPLSER